MKVKLNVGERMIVLGVLPKEGNFVTIRMIRTLISKLGLSAEEIKDYEVVEDNGTVRWNPKKAGESEFEFADAELAMIKKSLMKLDEGNKLTQEMIPVYEKFVG